MRTFRYFFVIGLLLLTSIGVGQSSIDTIAWDFDIVGVDQGFSAGMSTHLAFDHQGYLWAATIHGLNRYDGTGVKVYNASKETPSSIPDDHVTTVFVDTRGWVWIGVLGHGVFVYQVDTDRFRLVASLDVLDVKEDASGYIWVKNTKEDWTIVKVETGMQMQDQFEIIPCRVFFKGLPVGQGILSVLFSSDGKIWWVDQHTLFVYKLDHIQRRAELFLQKSLDKRAGVDDTAYCSMIEDKEQGIVWVFGDEDCLALDVKTGQEVISIDYPFDMQLPYRRFSVIPLMVGADGAVFFVDRESEGLAIFQPDNGSFMSIITANSTAVNRKITPLAIATDANNNLWVATNGYGLYRYTHNRSRFSYYRPEADGVSIQYIFELTNGLISSSVRGATRVIDPKEDTQIAVYGTVTDPIAGRSYEVDASIPGIDSSLWTLYTDMDDHLLYNYGPNEEVLRIVDLQRDPLLNQGIEPVCFTNEHTLWAIVYPYELEVSRDRRPLLLRQYNLEQNDWVDYAYSHVDDSFTFGKLQDFYLDSAGSLWIALSAGGIILLDTVSNVQDHFHSLANPDMPSNNIYTFEPDHRYPDSILWVGTGAGLVKYTLASQTWQVYTTEDGLPNDVVYGILFDDYGGMWCSTNRGLFLFDPLTENVRTFTKSDGLQHNEFNKRAYLKGSDGMFYFGGVGGLNYFRPEVFYDDTLSSTTIITELKIDNLAVEYGSSPTKESSLSVSKPINVLDEIILDHNDGMLTIGFACLDLTEPKRNQYRYRLIGFNDTWIEVGNSNQAIYTNIPPGEYVFQVQAGNSHHVWDRQGATMNIVMLTPWWQTWWFYSLILVGLTLIVYLIYRSKLAQRERIFALRNDISKDLHDEIGSTLSSISLFGTVAETMIDEDNLHAKEMLQRITKSTTHIMESMNDIVWTIDSDNDEIAFLAKRMRAFAYQMCEAANVEARFDIDSTIQAYNLTMSDRRNVYLIFKEAVNNAVKHAKCTQLQVDLQKEGRRLVLQIKDNGIGFNTTTTSNQNLLGGNGLSNMQARADELNGSLTINTGEGEGTCLQIKWLPST